MRVEPYGVGSVLHVIKRGARGMDIVRDEGDCWRFVRSLYLLNDHFQDLHRDHRYLGKSDMPKLSGRERLFARPPEWPERKPLVAILGWTLVQNHFHLLIQEIMEGGLSKFMQRFCNSMTRSHNEKQGEIGSLFQGAYKSRTVDSDEYLQYVHAYITVKNTLENYPGGLEAAIGNFDDAWQWAHEQYPFSSFVTSATGADSVILDMNAMRSLGLFRKDFKHYAKSMLATHADTREDLAHLLLETW